MRIIADSSSLFTPAQGRDLGLSVIPACTIIGNDVYKDHEDISSEVFLEKIQAGATPTSSQPSIGDILEVYQSCQDEMLVLPIGDGLSGTYQNMLAAERLLEEKRKIHVMDTKTLAGPQWYLVKKAMQLRAQGKDIDVIKDELKKCIDTSASFVIPQDFNFLKRSGRLTPVAAKIGTLLKIAPILTQTQDMKRITLLSIKRARKKAIAALIDHFKELDVNEDYLITVSHGGVREEAVEVMNRFKEHFSSSAFELFTLPPALICHGGPGCILIQTIKM